LQLYAFGENLLTHYKKRENKSDVKKEKERDKERDKKEKKN
jgi:hypothetical protein